MLYILVISIKVKINQRIDPVYMLIGCCLRDLYHDISGFILAIAFFSGENMLKN